MDHLKLVKQELSFTEEEELEIKIEDHPFDLECMEIQQKQLMNLTNIDQGTHSGEKPVSLDSVTTHLFSKISIITKNLFYLIYRILNNNNIGFKILKY